MLFGDTIGNFWIRKALNSLKPLFNESLASLCSRLETFLGKLQEANISSPI